MNFKYKFNLTQIVDEMGDLKPIGIYKCNTIPNIGDQIVVMIYDDSGIPIQRCYFQVLHFVHYAEMGGEGEILQRNTVLGDLQVQLLLDEGV